MVENAKMKITTIFGAKIQIITINGFFVHFIFGQRSFRFSSCSIWNAFSRAFLHNCVQFGSLQEAIVIDYCLAKLLRPLKLCTEDSRQSVAKERPFKRPFTLCLLCPFFILKPKEAFKVIPIFYCLKVAKNCTLPEKH